MDLKQYKYHQLQLYIQCIDVGEYTGNDMISQLLCSSLIAAVSALHSGSIPLITSIGATQLYYDTETRLYVNEHNDDTVDITMIYATDTQHVLYLQMTNCTQIDDTTYEQILNSAIEQCSNVVDLIHDVQKQSNG